MNARDRDVRKLAGGIVVDLYGEPAPRGAGENVAIVADRIRAFLAERDEAYARDLNDWRKGVELIASALGEKDPPNLSCVRLSDLALTRSAEAEECQGQLAALRGLALAYEDLDRALTPHLDIPRSHEVQVTAARNRVAGLRYALAPGAGEREAEVLRAAARQEAAQDAVDHSLGGDEHPTLMIELAKAVRAVSAASRALRAARGGKETP